VAQDQGSGEQVSDDQETELNLARRAAQTMYLTYDENEDAASLRARTRAAWAREFGENSGAIVPPWLGKILNEVVT
jgi:hypothetical protein